jgi:transposase
MDLSISSPVSVIGFDLGDRYGYYSILGRDGRVEGAGRVRMTGKKLREFFGQSPRVRVAIEAGTHSPWVSRLLTDLGHDVIVANPRQLAFIYKSAKKTDEVDAEKLARVARLDPELLCPIRHRGKQAQADLAVVRSRDALVRCRGDLIRHLRGSVKSMGVRIPGGLSPAAFHHKAEEYLPEELLPALKPILESLSTMTEQIKVMDREIERLCKERYPETSLLRRISGVGPITALTFVLTIEDPHRFLRSRDVAAFLGLVPRRDSSGRRDPELSITKAGDRLVRRLLVQCAHHILAENRPDTDIRRWGVGLANRGGKNAKKRAVVAVARKLSVVMHRLWVTGQEYEPLRQSKRVA